MRFNNPDDSGDSLSPTTYTLEEYEPFGMSGIMILEASLDVEVDSVTNEPYVSSISFGSVGEDSTKVPFEFAKSLIAAIHADKELMDDITEACAEEYSNNQW